METSATLIRRDSDASRMARMIVALRKFPPAAVDAVIVTVLIGLGLLEQLTVPDAGSFAHQVIHGAVIAGAIVPLLVRRRFPFLALMAIAAMIGVTGSLGPAFTSDLSLRTGSAGNYSLMFATFTAVAAVRRGLAWAALALTLTVVTLQVRPWETPPELYVYAYPTFLVAFVAGEAQRRRRELAHRLQGRLVEEQAQRERLQQLALQEARNGLARDLHDVVAHALAQMMARAQEAMRRLQPPADPGPAIEATEAAGRTALSELRRLLEVLHSDDAVHDRTAQPDLAALEELVRGAFPSSVEVNLLVEGDVTRVPAPVALATYRIVQEALTNTRQHSDPNRVEVRVRAARDELQLDVYDHGRPTKARGTPGAGLGILGMRERCDTRSHVVSEFVDWRFGRMPKT